MSRKSSPTSVLRSDLGVGAFRPSTFVSRCSQYLAEFAHPLESRRDILLYPQRVLLEKRGGAMARIHLSKRINRNYGLGGMGVI